MRKILNKGGIYNSKKYGLKGMQHKIPTSMLPQNNRKLSWFFYNNLIILSSVFRPFDSIYSFANEYLNSKLRYNRYLWNFQYLFRRNLLNHIILTMFEYPRGDAGGLSREYVIRIPSVS